MDKNIEKLCVNTFRMLAADMVEAAQSGHPGTPMGISPLAHVLWTRFLRFNPKKQDWPDRDRFVLSNGHASTLFYSLLHLFGFGLSLDDLKQFRQLGSSTPGHPEKHFTPGVEITTGPLGQGLSSAVGMAMAEVRLASEFNKPDFPSIVDHYTYVFCSDGDLMEGVTSEAASLAGCLKLGKLICMYDDNSVTIEGPTNITFKEDVAKRYEAYGWYVQKVADGNDMTAIENAIRNAQKETGRPSIILIKTVIGFGSPSRQGKSSAHYGAFGEEELKAIRKSLGWEYEEPFTIPEQVYTFYERIAEKKSNEYADWEKGFESYSTKYPHLAKEFTRRFSGELPAGWEEHLPVFAADKVGSPTRMANSDIINGLAGAVPELIGGSADLAPNTQTLFKDDKNFYPDDFLGRNIRFGVREHAMMAVVNGMSLHGGLKPYCATFLVFADYMRPSLRLAALSGASPVVLFTNDSIGLGEDGPTHQPIEQLAMLRATPNLTLIRPCDSNETVIAWKYALENNSGPTCISLSRQPLPILDRKKYASEDGLYKGAYIISEAKNGKPKAIIIATGSEVHLALEAQEILEKEKIAVRVVSMPSWKLFQSQSNEYQESVLPEMIEARIAVEAGASFGWERWVGRKGKIIAIDEFGVSGKGEEVFAKFGFTTDNIGNDVILFYAVY
jgi:transketolase